MIWLPERAAVFGGTEPSLAGELEVDELGRGERGMKNPRVARGIRSAAFMPFLRERCGQGRTRHDVRRVKRRERRAPLWLRLRGSVLQLCKIFAGREDFGAWAVPPVARDKMRGLRAGLAVVADGDSGFPRRLGEEQEGVGGREDANFVALHLVGAAASDSSRSPAGSASTRRCNDQCWSIA